ncbi:MAG: thermonuclease family protein [Pseudomonadota bacterium]
MIDVRTLCLSVVLLVGVACPSAQAEERLVGTALLIDGDTIRIAEQGIRLNGIDTPEPAQRCLDAKGKSYRCGKRATDALNRLIRGRPVVCVGAERDDYDRLIAECAVGDVSLNRELVRMGWAVAYEEYTDRYLADALEAQKAARGIWRGSFQRPHDFRALRWKVEAQVAPDGCPIKGNISNRGKIYHTPWSQYYTKTKITLSRGERWFCDEAEAQRAGWRPPLR